MNFQNRFSMKTTTDIKEVLYVAHNEKIGVLSDNEHNVVSHILGTDLTLVFDKKSGRTFVLVPLTKNHTFRPHLSLNGEDWIEVDGKAVHSDNFFKKDACQWIEVKTKEVLSEVA